jgi:DnaJ-class molecular chaperone
VPTLDGQVALKIPRGSNTGSVLRLKGKGIVDSKSSLNGDQYVKLKVVLPDPPDSELATFLERWAKDRSYDVRKKVGLG